eukprot:jgi/Psemu1/4958/gm1.4958_g
MVRASLPENSSSMEGSKSWHGNMNEESHLETLDNSNVDGYVNIEEGININHNNDEQEANPGTSLYMHSLELYMGNVGSNLEEPHANITMANPSSNPRSIDASTDNIHYKTNKKDLNDENKSKLDQSLKDNHSPRKKRRDHREETTEQTPY